MNGNKHKVFSGTSNLPLAEEVAKHLKTKLGNRVLERFSDGEVRCKLLENVRDASVFIIQATSAPTDENLMELLVFADACRRASARELIAVIPYFGYARQDRKDQPRTPISAKLVASLIETSGIDHVLTVDLHAAQIQGFFHIRVDHLYATPVLLEWLMENKAEDVTVVSPDAGGVERARAVAKKLGANLAIVDKRRIAPNKAKVMNIIGDVKGKDVLVLDDIIDTAGTLVETAKALRKVGAKKVMAFATHGVLSGPAIARINKSALSEVLVTNTIDLERKAAQCKKLEVLSMGKLLAEAIKRLANGTSLSSLFSA